MIRRSIRRLWNRAPELDVVHPDGKNLASVLKGLDFEVDDRFPRAGEESKARPLTGQERYAAMQLEAEIREKVRPIGRRA